MNNATTSQKISVLLVENVHSVAKERLESEGFHVDLIEDSPSENQLLDILPKYQAFGFRSKTEVRESLLKANPHLLALGAFCIGTNQVDLNYANLLGIPLFNAPYSNTRSVAELVLTEMIALARHLCDVNLSTHRGDWKKSSKGSFEIRGKTLGIVGYGHIGSQVSILAEALGMKVLYYDIIKKLPLGNAQSIPSLQELMEKSDFITLHVPETTLTHNMISKKEFSWMKKGSYILNASRGSVIVIEDLVHALKSNHISGCAIDVFPEEPSSNNEIFKSDLQNLPNVILTPHVGGSTEEAQYNIGLEVAESFVRFLKIGSTSDALNFPKVDLPLHSHCHRILNVHRNEPGILGEINNIVSRLGGNIDGQYLSTDAHIGYMVMDVEKSNAEALSEEISKLSRSIKTRLLY